MRLPISLALAWPDRLPHEGYGMDWSTAATWEFLPLDEAVFPAVRLCREAGVRGGTAPAALNAANEECVAAFLAGTLPFAGILETVERVVQEHGFRERPTLSEVLETEVEARAAARRLVGGAAEGSSAWS
jgi:1-deoxy-D-xylulose-5-phosphate reductoisomerase